MSEQAIFSAGIVWATLTRDANGTLLTTPQKIQVGTVQEASVSVSAELKKLMGSGSQFSKKMARGAMTGTGNLKFGTVSADVFNLFFGQTVNSGKKGIWYETVGAAIGSTHAITVTPPNSGVFSGDLGVTFTLNAQPLKLVASSPTTGQYSFNASTGEYTFAAADEGKNVYINYKYNVSGATDKNIAIQSLKMGSTPSFELDIYLNFEGADSVLSLPYCVATKFDLATKLDDFTIPSVDFEFAAKDGNVGSICLAY